jgi:hypothetical protein
MVRPSTLRAVSERVADGADPTKEFSEFLDHFYDRATQSEMAACLEDAPVILEDEKLNVLYAATAEYLSKGYRLSTLPGWIDGPQRTLREPWFTSPDKNVHEYLTFTSPAEFRSRSIFTEAAPLRRARTWQAEQQLAASLEQQSLASKSALG